MLKWYAINYILLWQWTLCNIFKSWNKRNFVLLTNVENTILIKCKLCRVFWWKIDLQRKHCTISSKSLQTKEIWFYQQMLRMPFLEYVSYVQALMKNWICTETSSYKIPCNHGVGAIMGNKGHVESKRNNKKRESNLPDCFVCMRSKIASGAKFHAIKEMNRQELPCPYSPALKLGVKW